ncbi:MAG: RNA polymerase sigma factor [Lachnospiraceae bacterium]|nr:RNA polymerase sigma factor [Lachnospiraceae bacterium]MBQ7781934.1 RNA polymerase sigma factor [Lachnospiraceae bacterium]
MLFFIMLLDTEEEKSFFETLYYEYRQGMYGLAYSILADSHAAEDAVHTVFLRLIKHIEKVEKLEKEKQKSYLLTAVKHAALDIKRKQKRYAEIRMEEVPENLLTDSEMEFWEKELVMSILKLPIIYREVLQYKYAVGVDNKQIADMLGITESTVRKRLERAKKMLKEQLQDE